jgi:hypothetical protein
MAAGPVGECAQRIENADAVIRMADRARGAEPELPPLYLTADSVGSVPHCRPVVLQRVLRLERILVCRST